MVALIAGWVTTEVGRQPSVVYGYMRTEEVVTGASGIPVGYATLVVYAGLLTRLPGSSAGSRGPPSPSLPAGVAPRLCSEARRKAVRTGAMA